MKSKYLFGAAAAALVCGTPLAAQEDGDPCAEEYGCPVPVLNQDNSGILVSASRGAAKLSSEDYTGAATIISPDQIEDRQTRNIEDVLRDVPGVAVNTVAGQTQIRLRGTEANHVLVLVDGIEVSDPGSGEFDIGTLQAEIGSRVEVLRGPQSALYGNDAIGGVVAYDSGEFDGFGIFAEGGENNTVNGAARWGMATGTLSASFSAVVVSTDGEPNARPSTGGGIRDIGRDSYTLSGKLNAYVSENVELRGVLRYVRTGGEFNDQDFGFLSPTVGFVIDSPGNAFESEALSGLAGARIDAFDGAWVHDLSVQFTDADRQTTAPAGFPSSTESDRFKASYISAYDFSGSDHTITFAADYELEGFNNVLTFDDRNESETLGLVGEYRYSGDRFDLAAAIRHDVNDLFKDATTFRLGVGYQITETTRLRAAFGTGVKNPTLNELFGFFDGRFIGNPDLEPEESTSWEIGFDQSFADDAALLSVTYFNAELDSEIFTSLPPPNFVATPGNRMTQSKQEGVEVALTARIGPQWSVNAAYSYLDAEENGVEEVRRPQNIASAAITWTAPSDAASATLVVRLNGEMLDSDFTTGAFPAPTTTLSSFTLVNLNARFEIAENLEIFARAENLLDEDYEQVFTFVSPGRQVIAGFRASF